MTNEQQVARWLADAQRAVAFTGAGISTESGIPDFRSPRGIWSQSRPVYFDEFMASADARYEYWRQKSAAHRDFANSQPNAGHRVLAEWERAGRLIGVITQNIDGLHQLAGSQQILELHGTARQIGCLDCEARFEADAMVASFLAEDQVPRCPNCGRDRLKHATISFGQQLDARVLGSAERLASETDLMFAIGSSLVVYPAAAIPQMAERAGARLVIINRDPTPLDTAADVVFRASIGQALNAIDAAYRNDFAPRAEPSH